MSEKQASASPSRATSPRGGSDSDGAIVFVMGVSGCGKSTVARLLAERMGAYFRDGDELHPPRNIELMSSGTPLSDEDRWPWLEAVRVHAVESARRHGVAVIACSALKRRYRDVLDGPERAFYVFLQGSRELIAGRMHERTGHFMPEQLLDSQFDALESPIGEPRVVTIDITPTPDVIAAAAEAALREHPEFSNAIGLSS